MKQISIYPVIVKSKALSDGSHKIRIAVSYKDATRYIITRHTVPSEKNFRKGEVVNLPTAAATNRKLRDIVNKYYNIFDEIPNSSVMSCAQIVDIFKDGGLSNDTSLIRIANLWIESKVNSVKPTSINLYRKGINYAVEHFGEYFQLSILSPSRVNGYVSFLKNKKGLCGTTILIKMEVFKCIINYGISHGHLRYNIDPFLDFTKPPKVIRDVALTIGQLRKLRDIEIDSPRLKAARDYFMFSFYTCGMNIADVMNLDIRKDIIKFRRTKTINRRGADEWTAFKMQPEAREIANRSRDEKKLLLYYFDYKDIQHLFSGTFKAIRKKYIPDCPRLIYYSARKTFAQLAAELNVSDCVIEYCLGDKESKSKVISFYRHTTMEMADREIRKVLDFVASDLSVDEWLNKEYK